MQRTWPVLTIIFVTSGLYPLGSSGQDRTNETAVQQVDIVHTIGCVDQRNNAEVSWWLTKAADPTVTEAGPFDTLEVDKARNQDTGSREFQLIGVAEFVDATAQLAQADRALFTTEEQVNATNDLQQGHLVLVKGLLIEADRNARINLLSVVGLANTCS